jgi:hypothetical protein
MTKSKLFQIVSLIGLAVSMFSCTTNCIETTYLNGEHYSEFEYPPFNDGLCYCTESTYTVQGDTFETVCSYE